MISPLRTPSVRRILYYAAAVLFSLLFGFFVIRPALRARSETSLEPQGDGEYEVQARGYHGPVFFRLKLDRAGRLTDFTLLSSREHPLYAPREAVEEYLGRLVGRKLSEVEEVDGISGATVTTEGIRTALLPGRGRVDWAALGLFSAFWLLTVALTALRSRRLLLAAGFLWLIYVGVLENSLLSIYSLLQLSSGLLLLPGAAVATALLYRNVYCRHVCPFGFLQNLAARIPLDRMPGLRRSALPGIARAGKFFLLAVAVGSFIMADELYLEPYVHLFSRKPLWWLYLLPAGLLLVSVFVRRFWCRGFCPLGAALELAEKVRQWGVLGVRPRWGLVESGRTGAVPLILGAFALVLLSNVLLLLYGTTALIPK